MKATWHKQLGAGRIASAVFVLWVAIVLSITDTSHTSPYRAVATVPTGEPETAGDAPATTPRLRVLLLGDAGLIDTSQKVLNAAAERAHKPAEHTVVLYLGDNVYPEGLPAEGDPTRREAERSLDAQLHAFDGTNTVVYFTPGNHDWVEGAPEGEAAVVREAEYIEQHATLKARSLPQGAEPGPSCVDEGGVRLIFVDTQWWLHEASKPQVDKQTIHDRLIECLQVTRPILFVTHHPPATHGVHGGYFTWRDHVFPLTRLASWAFLPVPALGSLYPTARQFGISVQDVTNDTNRAMLDELGAALQTHKPLAWVAGHDHNLQVMQGGYFANYNLVSGSGSKTSPVTDGKDTLFAQEALGFMEITFFEGGRAQLLVFAEAPSGSIEPEFSLPLKPAIP